jgi:nitroreductase
MSPIEMPITCTRQFFEVAFSQRACREFADRPVTDDEIRQILLAATFAPSAMNHQPWVFVVLRSAKSRAALTTIMRDLWEGGGRSATEGRVPVSLLDEVDLGFTKTLQGAPVLVVVAGDTGIAPADQLPWSIFPAVQNLLLAATAMGLGSALTTLATFRASEVQEITGLPPALIPMAIIPVGWPARELGPPRRLPLEGKAFRETYGQPF